MSFSMSKMYNKERVFDVATEGFEYFSLEELFEDESVIYTVRGVYINSKGLYDDAPVLALDDKFVNLPAFMTPNCKDILNDKRAIRAIKDGCVGFQIYTYEQKKYHKTCYAIRWVDIEPDVDEINIEG